MEGKKHKGHLVLVKPTGNNAHKRQGTFLKPVTNSEPSKQNFHLAYNVKRDIGTKTLAGLNEQRKQGDDDASSSLCDVVLVIEDRSIHAHKSVLAVRSEYFRAMFTTGMMESRKREVEMHGTTYSALSAALEFIYTGAFVVSVLILDYLVRN